MARPGPRRPNTAVRMSEEQQARADARAEAEGVGRSELVRLALEYALKHMPRGWRP